MNAVDIAIIAVTVISCLLGVGRGLVREVLSLLIWVAALIVARLFSGSVAALMIDVIDNDGIRYVVAFAVLFIITMMIGTVCVRVIVKLLSIAGLQLTDRLLGALFGFARGVIIVLVIQFFATPFVADTRLWQESQLVPYGVTMIERSRLFIEDVYDSGNLNLPVQF